MERTAALSKRLSDRLDVLTQRVARIERELGAPLDADFEEQAIDLEGHDTLEAMEAAAIAEIAEIRQAQARIAAGRYGICTQCGGAIAPKRLDVLPTAALCIDCAKL